MPEAEDFAKFYKTLQDKLPVTFRVNPGLMNYQALITMFNDPNFVETYWESKEGEVEAEAGDPTSFNMGQTDHAYGDKIKKMKFTKDLLTIACKPYYPQQLVYEMMIPGNLFKKVEGLKAIHKMIDLAKDSGLITRQEIVSMMPPILCDIKSSHSVFDMCAAPGSKTA